MNSFRQLEFALGFEAIDDTKDSAEMRRDEEGSREEMS